MKPCIKLEIVGLTEGLQELSESSTQNNDTKIDIKRLDAENKVLESRITDLCHAIQCLYQYWDCFQLLKEACDCVTFCDVADMDAVAACRSMNTYCKNKGMSFVIKPKDVRCCIAVAKCLCQQRCD